jgi:hypothetical protein
LESIELAYVRPDGTLDERYGRINITTGVSPPPKPPDDPTRPTGAPRTDGVGMVKGPCPHPRWTPHDDWSAPTSTCIGMFELPAKPPDCSPSDILARARADHAPDGLAVISAGWNGAWSWKFEVSDPDRGVSFERRYEDCAR